MSKPAFSYGNVFHSELVKYGPVKVKLKGDPFPSKSDNVPDGASHVVGFEREGSDKSHWLIIEDSALEDVKTAPKKEWVTLEATGTKGGARLHFAPSENGGGSAPTNTPPSAPRTVQSDIGLHALMDTRFRQMAETVREEFPDASADAQCEAAERMAVSLFIGETR